MVYEANDYHGLIGLKGFSKELLENHFALYEGYVKNANKLMELLTGLLEEGTASAVQFSELNRRLSFELNGIKLHEYYFENMHKDSAGDLDKESWFYQKTVHEFGSYQDWLKSFKAVASMRGVGWAITIYDARSGLLINTWVDDHHIGHVAGTEPLLVLDLWEHALLLDYGSDRGKYIEAFLKVVDWNVVTRRFEEALEQKELQFV